MKSATNGCPKKRSAPRSTCRGEEAFSLGPRDSSPAPKPPTHPTSPHTSLALPHHTRKHPGIDSTIHITGMGLAGCCLAWQRWFRGQPFTWEDDDREGASSRMAAG